MPNVVLDSISLVLGCSWDDNYLHWSEFPDEYSQLLSRLDEPSNLETMYLPYESSMRYTGNNSWQTNFRHKILDVSGTTVKEAIIKILEFYTPKKIYMSLGDHCLSHGITRHQKGWRLLTSAT
jgi:hypothetical protein